MQQPLYGLIGGKLGHSYSKIIHEKIADYTYELMPLPTEAEARTFMERRAFAAINVTIPYKQFVIPYCDVVDPKAQAIGAVNTIVNRDGKLYGYNTDYAGFAYLAGAHGVDFAGKTVLVLAPGASLAEEAGRNAVTAAKADCIVSANFCPEFCQPDYAFFTNSKRFEKLDLAALPCPVVLTSNLRPLPQGALAVNYDRLAAPDVQNASLGSNSVLMLLRLLRLCGAKAVLLAGADGYKPGTRQPAARSHRARCRVQHRHGRCHQSLRAGCDLYHPKRIRKITRFAHDSTFGSGCRRHHDRRRRVL